jgi:hypothetical protein
MPAFKTKDLTKLSTNARQPQFSNATQAAKNATRAQYLTIGGGKRSITPLGEAVVEALPDLAKVQQVLVEHAPLCQRE